MELIAKLANDYAVKHPVPAARALQSLPGEHLAAQLSRLEVKAAAAVASSIPVSQMLEVLKEMTDDQAHALFTALPVNVQLILLHGATDDLRDRLLDALPRDRARLLQRLSRYPAGCAAALMEPATLVVSDDLTVAAVLKLAGRNPDRVRFYVYVVDREQRLVGVVTLRQLIKADRHEIVRSIMEQNITSLRATTPHTEVLNHPLWQRFYQLPVVDDDGLLLGVVRYETWRREVANTHRDSSHNIMPTLLAFSELYWVGLSKTMFGGITEHDQAQGTEGKNE